MEEAVLAVLESSLGDVLLRGLRQLRSANTVEVLDRHLAVLLVEQIKRRQGSLAQFSDVASSGEISPSFN